MDSLLKNFRINGIVQIKELYNNLFQKGNVKLQKFNLKSETKIESKTYNYIYENIYQIIQNQKERIFKEKNESLQNKIKKIRRIFLRNINYLYKQITSGKILNNTDIKYNLTNKELIINLFFLIYVIIFYFHISLGNNSEIDPKNKYLIIKLLYNILKKITSITSKFYSDKLLDIEQLEIIIKTLIIFSVNNSYNIDIKKKNYLKNIMYLKESLKIIKLIYCNNSSKEEQNLLLNIIKYINTIICYLDFNNNIINYTNKIYLLNNDNKSTNFLSLMDIIFKINNEDINKAYFDLVSNIYNFQFNYHNFNWPFYKMLEPLLVNINTKNYTEILNEVSYPNFQLNFIRHLSNNEKNILEKNPFILKNGFYFGENSKNSGIIAFIDKMQDHFILNFGFKLMSSNEQIKNNEFILLQFKNINDNKAQLKISIIKEMDKYNLKLINHKNVEKYICDIIPYEYYVFSLQFKDSNLYVSYTKDNLEPKYFEVPKINYKFNNNLLLCVGCEIEINKNNKDKSFNYIFDTRFTGFFGDIQIISNKSFKQENLPINFKYSNIKRGKIDKKDKKELKKIDVYFLQRNFINLKGKYGQSIIKSILNQQRFNECIISNIEDSTKKINNQDDEEDFFRALFINEDINDKKVFKMIDNVVLYISSYNFKLINYMDSIDYLNYDDCYYEKEKNLNEIKKEYQFLNNYKIKRSNYNNKTVMINRKLFDCNFNVFENKSGLINFIEQDGIFYFILILEYYYQIIYKICLDIFELDKNNNKENNNIILSEEQKLIINLIEKGIENLLSLFYKKIICSEINLKFYLTRLFYYQLNVVLKQFILIQNINDNIYNSLIDLLEYYHDFIYTNFSNRRVDLEFSILARNFFFDFLLNPKLYKNNEDFDLLNNLDKLLGLNNAILQENLNNEELISEIIFNKLLLLVFIFKLNENDFINKEKSNIKEQILNIKKKYTSLLINYMNFFYSQTNNSIIKSYININEENNNSNIFYFLSFALYSSEIENYNDILICFIEYLIKIFRNYYLEDNDNSKIISITSLLILSHYYMNCQMEDDEKEKQFKLLFNNLDSNRVIIYFTKVFNLILKGNNEKENIFNNYKELYNNNLTKNFDFNKYGNQISLFLKLILSIINGNYDLKKNIIKIINKDNINNFYLTFKYLIFIISVSNNLKPFKKILSSENNFLSYLFYFKFIYSTKEEKISVGEDIIECCRELILFHNYPFIFKLIELINANANETLDKLNFINEEEKLLFNQNDIVNNNDNIKINKIITIDLIISILNTILDILKNYKFDFKITKNNKYYIRGLINFLIITNNICEMKEEFFLKTKTFINCFINLVQLIDGSYLIYSNYSIKLDNTHGKLISELIFDSFLNIFIVNNEYSKKLVELFNKIFLKGSHCTILYILDLIKNSNLDNEIKKMLDNYNIDITKIKAMKDLLKPKKTYNLDDPKIRNSLPNYKCLSIINKINYGILFLCKSFIYIIKENSNNELSSFLFEKFIPLSNQNIKVYKKSNIKYYNEEKYEDDKLYTAMKNYFDGDIWSNDNHLKNIKEFFTNNLAGKFDSKIIQNYFSSLFIWKQIEQKNINDKNETEKNKNDNNDNVNQSIIYNNNLLRDNSIKHKDSAFKRKSKKIENSKSFKNFSLVEEELNKIKKNINSKKYINHYYTFLDNIKNRCFIYNPKNTFIKRIFSHIYYNLLFYDKSFMYIKNKYLRAFPSANIYSKQINYPSKIKNFSNIYEPKIFLKKDFNFYDEKYLYISHDFLFKTTATNKKELNESKIKLIKSLLDNNLSLVNFYEHNFDISEILEDKGKYFDCELVTQQYTYFGYIIFGEEYIYFDTKNDSPPVDNNKFKKEDYDLEEFCRFCFSNRNRDNITDKKKKLIIFYQNIKTIIKRRTLLMNQSMEIFCDNGKSFFFNFFKKENCENVFKILYNFLEGKKEDEKKYTIVNDNINEEIKKINNEVKKRNINNYTYLNFINFYSSRSFNDVNQYPVFPWIIMNFQKLENLLELEKNYKGKIVFNNNMINSLSGNNEDEKLADNEDLIEEKKNDDISKDENQNLFNEYGLRVFSYPLSMQIKEKRENSIFKFRDEGSYRDGKFRNHHGAHYSTSSYVFFFLHRINPYSECLIKLQNYSKENSNRLFISYNDTLTVFNSLPENRELIPNLFCHIDFYCNLNCAYNGNKSTGELIDDFYDNKNKKYSQELLSEYYKYLYLFRKMLNSNLVSKFLPNWLDNIFGINQLPDNKTKLEESCNIYNKSSYEKKMNLFDKLYKYKKKLNNNEINKNELAKKLLLRIDLINNFGITPRKVLESHIKLKTSTIFNNIQYSLYQIKKNIYFIKSNENILILYKNVNNKEPTNIKEIEVWNPYNINIKMKKKIIYPCGFIKRLQKYEIKKMNDSQKIPIFKPCYSMTSFMLFNKLFILTCRYLGNIFKIQNIDYYIDVLCEDFVSCITCKTINTNLYNTILVYSGLKNGKLIEWFIKERLNSFQKIVIKEKKNCHCHKGEITCIELYNNQNIIITGGEDKMIFIRKTFDFELLTVINLTYLYCNPIFNKVINIVPVMIKISQLNCIYVMIYNYTTKKSFIRSYNFNGLFFAQSTEDDYMNICFTKNSNLLASVYNQDKIYILNCYNLKSIESNKNYNKDDNLDLKVSELISIYLKEKNKKKKKEENDEQLVWIDYDYKKQEFILLFKDKIIKTGIENKDKKLKMESY